jgi:hypothetical protein
VKLGELRACDGCGGPLCANITFLAVRLQLHALRPEAARQALALSAFYGGSAKAQALAMTFVDHDDAAPAVGEGDELLLCPECWPGDLQAIAERRRAAIEAAAAPKVAP